jgi:hypothetical protein
MIAPYMANARWHLIIASLDSIPKNQSLSKFLFVLTTFRACSKTHARQSCHRKRWRCLPLDFEQDLRETLIKPRRLKQTTEKRGKDTALFIVFRMTFALSSEPVAKVGSPTKHAF